MALALTYQQAGKAYHAIGRLPALFAAGSLPVAGWLGRGRQRLRLDMVGTAAAVSGAMVAVLVLPILPASVMVSSGVPELNEESGEQIGWPELVAAVDEVVRRLPPEERERAVIITSNYAEAGAIELLGRDLPPVYSGLNSYWDFGQPPDDAEVAIVVGRRPAIGLGDCRNEGRVDNGVGVRNEEQGASIQARRRLPASWSEIWSAYRHLD